MSDEREVVQKHRSGCPMAGDIVGKEPHFTNKCRCRCEGRYDAVSAEVVRAWVARGARANPRYLGEYLWLEDADTGERYASLPRTWFPTLAPGEYWPVEIRRVTEEAP